jgi:hypothetical protein
MKEFHDVMQDIYNSIYPFDDLFLHTFVPETFLGQILWHLCIGRTNRLYHTFRGNRSKSEGQRQSKLESAIDQDDAAVALGCNCCHLVGPALPQAVARDRALLESNDSWSASYGDDSVDYLVGVLSPWQSAFRHDGLVGQAHRGRCPLRFWVDRRVWGRYYC